MAEVQILTLSCKDQPGITAKVASYLFARGRNVLEAQQFNDQDQNSFFMRVEFDPGAATPRKVLLLVSKFNHCLGDLLYRNRIGELAMEVVSHSDTPDDMVRKGRDIERRVLATTTAMHLEDRVLVNGTKTIVFKA